MDEQRRVQGQQEHPATLPKQDAWQLFACAMVRLIGSDRPSLIARYLERCTVQDVRDWRRRGGRVPGWALSVVEARLREIELGAARDRERLALVPVAPGQGSHRNICKWNQRRYAKAPAKSD